MYTRPGEIPFIDREDALAALAEFTSASEGRCLLLVGRRGIGKRRLLRRFMAGAAVDAWGPPRRICIFHQPHAGSPPLASYVSLEKAIADHPEIRQLADRSDLPQWIPDLLGWVRKMLVASDPVAGPVLGALEADRMVEGLLSTDRVLSLGDVVSQFQRTLLYLSRRLGEEQRLVLMFDLVTYLDDAAVDPSRMLMLLDIVRELPALVLAVVTLRNLDPASSVGELLRQPNVEVYRDLEPFASEDVRVLLQTVFGGDVPTSSAEAICQKYGGDPFSLELAINAVPADAADPARHLREQTPAKLNDLMRLGYESLARPLERKVLRALSVAIEPVPVGFVHTVLGGGEDYDDVDLALNPSDLPRLVEMVPRSGLPDCFRIYQPAYAEFVQKRATRAEELAILQGRAGAYYEARKRPALALHHYVQAQDLAGMRRNLDPGLEWHRWHGETRRIQDLYEELRHSPLEDRERYLLEKAHAWSLSQRGEAEEVVRTATELLEDLPGSSPERAELLVLRADAYHNSSRYAEAIEDFRAALGLLEELGEEGSLLHRQARLEAAHIQIHLGEFSASVDGHFELTRDHGLVARPEDPRLLLQWARELRRYGELLVFTGDWSLAGEYLESALRAFRGLGHRKGQGNALRRLADLHILLGGAANFRRALKEARQGKDLLAELGGRGAGWMDLVVGEALRGLGRYPEAREAHGRAWERYRDGESPHLQNMAELALAECDRSETGAARMDVYDRVVRSYEELGFRWGIGTALVLRALAHASRDNGEGVESNLARAEELFREMELEPPLRVARRIREGGHREFYPIIVL